MVMITLYTSSNRFFWKRNGLSVGRVQKMNIFFSVHFYYSSTKHWKSKLDEWLIAVCWNSLFLKSSSWKSVWCLVLHLLVQEGIKPCFNICKNFFCFHMNYKIICIHVTEFSVVLILWFYVLMWILVHSYFADA